MIVALLGSGLAAYGELASHAQQREREAELKWIGGQFREAIGLYYQRTPGSVKRYPQRLEDLLQDRRFLNAQRYLRRVYRDPMTGTTEWGLVQAPEGGIAGVYSLSEARSISQAVLGQRQYVVQAGALYQDWKFTYEPPSASALR
ncbi:MAG: type II secretion system protein [Betaproteobacteria bacterium]|nr:type II secretion system protein [Betaproteobacteria bacterium]MDH5352559.1 type II secretion system protein [Betaproteobacteria bacterium]